MTKRKYLNIEVAVTMSYIQPIAISVDMHANLSK